MVAGAKHLDLKKFNVRQLNRKLNTRRKDQQELIQLVFDRIHHSNVNKPISIENTKFVHPNNPVNMDKVEGGANVRKENIPDVMENIISGNKNFGGEKQKIVHPTDHVNKDEVKGVVNEIKEDVSCIEENELFGNISEGETYENGVNNDIIKELSNANSHAISYKTKSRKLKKIKKNIKHKTNSIIVGNCIANANEPSFYTNNDKFLLHTKILNANVLN